MKIALIGNQNCGKTSLFNKLTGSNQKIGNWPGVTIERKEGVIIGTDLEIVDLPGVYSLQPYSSEEEVSRDYLLNEKPDVVLNVIDSTALERSLYLTTQLLDLGERVVLALNMNDLLDKKGIVLDEDKLSKELGVPAIKTSAKTGLGILDLIEELKNQKTQKSEKNIEIYPKIIENEIKNTKNSLKNQNKFSVIEKILDIKSNENASVKHSRDVLKQIYGEDLEQVFANEKYNFIESVRDKCLSVKNKKETKTDKLDKIFLNRWLAIPIFALIMSFVYFLSVGVVGGFTKGVLENFVQMTKLKTSTILEKWGASNWAVSLVVDGMISGIGAVLSFVPQLVVIFLCISILETSGYMSRIAFMFDRLFRKFGLSGKSLVPFIVGTGCSVPAISTTKTIESENEKKMTIILTPFIPCSAKLPIIALFAGYFFDSSAGLVSAMLYFFAIILIVLCSFVLKKFLNKNKETLFMSELPEYKAPNAKYVFRDVLEKIKDFVSRAGTIILFCSIIVWFLSSFGWNLRFCGNINNSILAGIGNVFGWFFYPIVGEWNWAVSISAIQGLVAKEQVVSSLSVIAGLSSEQGSIFSSSIFSCFNKASALAFTVFNLFSAPCFASIGAMKSELKSTKKAFFAVLFQICVAWIFSSLTFLVGKLIFGG